MKAPPRCSVVHSNFERGFIAGELVAYHDLSELGSYAKCREKGKLRIERQGVRHEGRRCRRVALQRLGK